MNQNMRNSAIDAIKGLAIIAVALYHFGGGYFPRGYLGVDVFLVVGGYLLIGGLLRRFEEGRFYYWSFLFRKIIRLWPLIIVVSALSLTLGYLLMLPDDYENLSQSVIASSFFANNILQCITTNNYWDVVNLYKPLMHLWYVGVLMQAYLIIPLTYLIGMRITKTSKAGMRIVTLALTGISLALYLLPSFSSAWKFYYLPFRLFEITIGGFPVLWRLRIVNKHKGLATAVSALLLLMLLCSRDDFLSGNLMLLLTVFLSLLFIWAAEGLEYRGLAVPLVRIGARIGEKSYSIYIWHQVIVAFLFYSFFPKQNALSLVVFILLTVILSLLSYYFIEIPLGRTIGAKNKETVVIVGTAIVATFLCVISFKIYCHAGVVRDVPELNISLNDVHRGMHAEYCDRPYKWDNDFEDDGRVKILVLGDSFGRDWANILYEWDVENKLDISYMYYSDKTLTNSIHRLYDADIVFCAQGSKVETVKNYISDDKIYIIGNKNYGESNGIIYARRFSENYFFQTVEINKNLMQKNAIEEEKYGDHFINLMEPVMMDVTHAKVFTDDDKFISQDCRHLTPSGAKYYARIMDLDWILNR